LPTVSDIVSALESDDSGWARETAALLRKRSPLILHVALEHVRRVRHMTLAADLRMERDMVRHCFSLRPGTAGETFEGIRALVIDKDHAPRWNPVRIERRAGRCGPSSTVPGRRTRIRCATYAEPAPRVWPSWRSVEKAMSAWGHSRRNGTARPTSRCPLPSERWGNRPGQLVDS
jgi:hypothetical protein